LRLEVEDSDGATIYYQGIGGSSQLQFSFAFVALKTQVRMYSHWDLNRFPVSTPFGRVVLRE
jgi:hypothetical protein